MYKLIKGAVIPFIDSESNTTIENNTVIEQEQTQIDMDMDMEEKNKLEKVLAISDELFVNVSHELRTPLNVIYSATQLMELSLTNDSVEMDKGKALRNVNSIKQSCYRLTKLINNITDISKIDAGNLKLNFCAVDIAEVIKNLVQASSQFVQEIDLKVIFYSNVDKKIVACDEEKIERVILNLISNAIKFSNPDGIIIVNMLDKGDTVEVSVHDNGIGINEQNLKNIFDRFSQVNKSLSRNAEGSGIGLYLVKSFIKLHGGKVSAQSKVGQGSTFSFEIPCETHFKLNDADKIIHHDINEIIKIEFSDINNKR